MVSTSVLLDLCVVKHPPHPGVVPSRLVQSPPGVVLWPEPVLVRQAPVRAALQQQHHGRQVAVDGGAVQGRLALVGAGVDLRVVGKERLEEKSYFEGDFERNVTS